MLDIKLGIKRSGGVEVKYMKMAKSFIENYDAFIYILDDNLKDDLKEAKRMVESIIDLAPLLGSDILHYWAKKQIKAIKVRRYKILEDFKIAFEYVYQKLSELDFSE